MPDSGLSLRPGSSATSSLQHPKVSGPVVSTEIVVEQLLSLGIAPGLDTQQWAMRTQAGYNLVGKLELKGQRLGGGYKIGTLATEKRGCGCREGAGPGPETVCPDMCAMPVMRQMWP